MADVTLRETLDLMRSFLRAGQLAEAFALGRHILRFFPKHIETYAVLAQVSLAAGDVAGATDLLRRVLSSDPENVVALAGMALISEAQDKHNEALWYLERAYEIQPSNDELRGELLRVRERYYGSSPMRFELTPGALARIYARQGQYAHAVNEYRRLLRTEPQRYDAQVGLVETLFRAGRTDEAAQVAQTVMTDAPYALKPNLILGALWTENAVPEGQQFLQRAHQLDPEHRVARDLLGEGFDGADPPRLPEIGETMAAPAALPAQVESIPQDEFPPERDTARTALLLSEIERAQEIEAAAQEPLVADPGLLERVERQPAASGSAPLGTAAKIAAGVVAANLVAEAPSPAEETAMTPEDVAPNVDPTLKENSEAERMQAEHETTGEPPSAATASANRSKSEGVSAEAIAVAAAALATSIALDKSNQPAPTRRAHPAIPKVRPVIPGNSEPLPAWLYISATPANANASFDALPATTADEVAPLPAQSDRPDWLVQAEAARQSEPVSVGTDDELPDWLMPAAVVGAATVIVNGIDQPSEMPPAAATDELDDSQALAADTLPFESPPVSGPAAYDADVQPSQSHFDAALAAVAAAAIVADRPNDMPEPAAVVPAPIAEESVTPESASDVLTIVSGEEPLTPVYSDVSPAEPAADESIVPAALAAAAVIDETTAGQAPAPETVAAAPASGLQPDVETPTTGPVTSETVPEERSQTQAAPDSATMLQMARDKRDSGDLKGALDLYERVMHRRPNHIDQVTADLEAIVSTGGAPLTANRLLGEAYAMAGRFKESLVQYRTALGRQPEAS